MTAPAGAGPEAKIVVVDTSVLIALAGALGLVLLLPQDLRAQAMIYPNAGQTPEQLAGLVGRDPTGDTEQNAPHRRWISRGSGT